MKKKIIIGLAIISALSFGATNNAGNNQTNGQRGMYQNQMMGNLSESQQTELKKVMVERREGEYKKSLDMRTKQLELEKLLAEDKVNWKSVEKINKEISDMRAKQSLEGMKFRKGIEDKYGIKMGHRGMGSQGHRGSGMKSGGQNGNGMKNGNSMNGGKKRNN
jgi:Spy/CpxP family protein refolding chaperone